jgi:uncharacterized membrane protein
MISGVPLGLQPPLEGMWFCVFGVVVVSLIVSLMSKIKEIVWDVMDW